MADVTVAEAGTPFTVGAVIEVTEGWHLYWEHPGDAGQETWADLALPEGWRASRPLYPGPDRFDTQGVESFGWEGGGAVLYEVTATTSATLTARVGWLACKEICVPGEADVEIEVPVGVQSPTDALDSWKARLPVSGELTVRQVSTTRFEIDLPAGHAEIFPGPELAIALVDAAVTADHISVTLTQLPAGAWAVVGITDPTRGVRAYHRVAFPDSIEAP